LDEKLDVCPVAPIVAAKSGALARACVCRFALCNGDRQDQHRTPNQIPGDHVTDQVGAGHDAGWRHAEYEQKRQHGANGLASAGSDPA
jgi:hypothetical protein